MSKKQKTIVTICAGESFPFLKRFPKVGIVNPPLKVSTKWLSYQLWLRGEAVWRYEKALVQCVDSYRRR